MTSSGERTGNIQGTLGSGAFAKYLKAHRIELYVFISMHILLAILLEYGYPYTDISSGTGGYINIITDNFIPGGPRPVSYSYFIHFVNVIARGTRAYAYDGPVLLLRNNNYRKNVF